MVNRQAYSASRKRPAIRACPAQVPDRALCAGAHRAFRLRLRLRRDESPGHPVTIPHARARGSAPAPARVFDERGKRSPHRLGGSFVPYTESGEEAHAKQGERRWLWNRDKFKVGPT